MCGVVGYQGDFDRDLLERMSASVAHRGPDGQGALLIEVEGAPLTGLAHRRLAIIDLSEAGRQPMRLACGQPGGMHSGLTLVYNGEIYNYRELRTQLEAQGHTFSTATDSEVLLHLYERYGLEMLAHLNGIFAFGIHDARSEGRPQAVARGALFIARDHLGVKPLYYAQTATGFLFASELKALLCCRTLQRTIDPIALHQTLAYLWTPAPRTMLREVRKLEPGSALLVSNGRICRHWSYYTIPYRGERNCDSFEESAEDLAAKVRSAVRRQLVADVPVGAYLSGGLDSSAVVAMMRAVEPAARIDCFCIGFAEDAESDGNPADGPYARQVARHLGVNLHEITMEHSAIDRLEQMIWLLDEPQADPAPINALLIAERSRSMGIPVLLSGTGGDDLFSGYRRHRALSLERSWAWLPRGARSLLQTIATGDYGFGQSRPLWRRLTKMFSYAGEEEQRRLISYFWWSTEGIRRGLYAPQFAEQVRAEDAGEPLLASLRHIPQEHDPLQRMLYLETRHFLADHNLNYTDRAGMAAGVEVRVPLLDLELVEFAARIPSHYKQRGNVGKAIFKKAMERHLPHQVIYRPKTGFGAPLRRWLRKELRQKVDEVLDPAALRRRGLFDADAVQRLLQRDRAGAVDGSYTIFALMCCELWCRRFVDVV